MHCNLLIAWLHLDPPAVAFTIPFFERPVLWYGICFVAGFVMGYFILLSMIRKILWKSPCISLTSGASSNIQAISAAYADRLTWFIVIGTIVGARIGHIIFYDWHYFLLHPANIIKTWEGGLASHGGTIGVLLGILLFHYWNHKKIPEISFISLIDIVAVPTALVACCIRIGNLFNQEILGYPTQLPWAIVFGHPADGSPAIPRHPVVLYEALAYLMTFLLLYSLWKYRSTELKPGVLSGTFFVCIFGSRFFIDYLKLPQSDLIDETFLQMGQYLSIPFILLGIILIALPQKVVNSPPQRM